eukprot:CAMPEP_0202907644 /NCGR_PEP_ID=MMETSP1392-20130828/43368_1 /ASSEMBLY_ACC=CAM_ASM_000868 /TAXON_ID=225041 /ORGANISM="Chlamydomonas chlamydogama, Strain SAG 11-48b" /LENGTH=441 /DNA_ID=CAMNT_0049596647 /DNA_START=275 /DNA_END=1600 /DNA_ORIENTATION=-
MQGTIKVKHKGYATPEGTKAFVAIMKRLYSMPDLHYRSAQGWSADEHLQLSSMGVGTYLGDVDRRTDEQVTTAVIHSVAHGWNIIDTASNYRLGHAEVSIGHALINLLGGNAAKEFFRDPIQARVPSPASVSPLPQYEVERMRQMDLAYQRASRSDITRDMLFISTKAGFVTRGFVDTLVQEARIRSDEVVQKSHCIHPECLRLSLLQSLERMNLKTVDLFYLHNAVEMQLPAIGRPRMMQRLKAAFEYLEMARAEGRIRWYGLATWDCFRKRPGDALYMSLADVLALAEAVGGSTHGLRFVQLPISAGMPEAFTVRGWQPLDANASAIEANKTFLEVAAALKVGVFASGPLQEGELLRKATGRLDGIAELMAHRTTAGKLLQFARSTPDVLSSLVGQKTREYVEDNLQVGISPPLNAIEFQHAYQMYDKIMNRVVVGTGK